MIQKIYHPKQCFLYGVGGEIGGFTRFSEDPPPLIYYLMGEN